MDEWKKKIAPGQVDNISSIFNAPLEQNAPDHFDIPLEYVGSQGQVIHTLCRGKILERDSEGKPKHVVGIQIDTTKLIQQQMVSKTLNVKLEKRKQELSMLLSLLAHDLRSPLNTIYAFGSILRAENKDIFPPHQLDWLDRSLSACEYANSIVDGVHTLAQVAQSTKYETLSLDAIAQEVCGNLSLDIEKSGAKIHCEQLPTIRGSKFCVMQALTNVIQNSLKFAKEGFTPEITLRPYKQQGVLVEDNGIGVPEKDLLEIFEMFSRLYPGVYQGTGAGLGIVKKAIELHNGHVWAENLKPHGLRVCLDFNNV